MTARAYPRHRRFYDYKMDAQRARNEDLHGRKYTPKHRLLTLGEVFGVRR